MHLYKLIITTIAVIHISNGDDVVVEALPDGSPVCTVGGPAPRSLHLIRPSIVTGEICLGNFQITIGNTTLNRDIVNSIFPDTDLLLELSSTTGKQFRGVLMILNQPDVDLKSNLYIDPNSTTFKVQDDCASSNYAGFTHVDNSLKSVANATMNLPNNQVAYLDVDIVIANNNGKSEYYYTRYQLKGEVVSVSAPISESSSCTTERRRESCGLFGISLFCLNLCGLFGRLVGLCRDP
jgi:hypothetical protein